MVITVDTYRVPLPEEIEADEIEVEYYTGGYQLDSQGDLWPVKQRRRYKKLELGPEYTVWQLAGEHNA